MAEKQTEIKLPERPSQSRKQLPNFDVAVPSPPLTKGPLSLSLVDLSLASLSLCTAHNSECFRALCHRDKSRTRNEKLIGGRSGGEDHKGIIVRLSGENSIYIGLFKVYCEKFVISNFLVSRLSWRLTRIFTGYNYTWGVYI